MAKISGWLSYMTIRGGTGRKATHPYPHTAANVAISEGKPADAEKIAQFHFKDIRPKAASEITDIADASILLGHSKQEITKRVYRRVGAIAKPSK